MEIKIELKDEAVKKALSDLGGKVKDPSPVMKAIGEYMLRSTEDRFRSQGPAPDGTPWAPLSRSTLRRKKHRKILTETTALRSSIHYQLMGQAAVAVGTGRNIPYAAIQQLGGAIKHKARSLTLAFTGKGRFMSRRAAGKQKSGAVRVAFAAIGAHETRIPARSYIGVSEKDSAWIVNRINQYLAAR
ncbi:MAG: phage virion morphogenesis protein [Thermodesulfobacteriota bacterium]